MPFISSDVVVRQVGSRSWRLHEPLVYQGATDRFQVPAGFRTDFASVPRALTWLLPASGDYTRAAILHDYLVREAPVDRADADAVFRRAMRELGVSVARRWMMWTAARYASRLRGAEAADVATFALVAGPSVAFVAVPAVVVQVYLVAFWAIELVVWAVTRLLGHPGPRPELRTGTG